MSTPSSAIWTIIITKKCNVGVFPYSYLDLKLLQESQSRYLILEMLAWISRLLLMIDICFPGEVRECVLVVYYRLIVQLLMQLDLFLAPKGSARASQSHAPHHGIKRRSSLRFLPSFLPVCLLRALPLSRSTHRPLLSIQEQNQAADQHVLEAKQRSTHQPGRNHQFVFLLFPPSSPEFWFPFSLQV